MKRLIVIVCFILGCAAGNARSLAGLKTNLAYWATATPNLALEVGLGHKTSLDLSGGYNPFVLGKERNIRIKHWAAQPEFRYWFCERFGGHFIGVHAYGGQHNMGGFDGKVHFLGTDAGKLENSRYQGWFAGGGVAYGYAWMLGTHWNLEAEIGIGYAYVLNDVFACAGCGKKNI